MKKKLKKYGQGGKTNPPIYTYDPNDPRIQHYTDSLLYYNGQDGTDYVGAANRLGLSIYDSNRTNFPKPVQPIVYKLWFNNLGGDYVGATESIKSFNAKMPTEINPIPFKEGAYFTRKRQGQETGKTEYFDKKTGKKLGEFAFGGLSLAPLMGKKGQDLMNFNSSGIPEGQGSHMLTGDMNVNNILGAPNPFDANQMAQWLAYSSSPQAKQDWMKKATPLQKSLSGLANPEGAEMLSGILFTLTLKKFNVVKDKFMILLVDNIRL